eukprot:CFRG3157T1
MSDSDDLTKPTKAADLFGDSDDDSDNENHVNSKTSPRSRSGSHSGSESDGSMRRKRKDSIGLDSDSDEAESEAGDTPVGSPMATKRKPSVTADLFGSDDESDDYAQEEEDGRRSDADEKRGGLSEDDNDLGLNSDSDSSGGDIAAIKAGISGTREHRQKKTKHLDDWKNVEITRPVLDEIVDEDGQAPVFVRIPKFLPFEVEPFSADMYEEEIPEDDSSKAQANVRLKVVNTVRWRHVLDSNGNQVKDPITDEPKMESNARFVTWDDGSISLFVGDEVIEVSERAMGEDVNHLYMKSKPSLYAENVFTKRYNFVPSSNNSFTHQIMKEKMQNKYEKTAAMKTVVVAHDPTRSNRDLIKLEDEKNSAKRRLENKRRKELEREDRLSTRFLEDNHEDFSSGSEGDFEERVAEIKQSKSGRRTKGRDYSEDDEQESDMDSEEEKDREKRLRNAKRNASDSNDSESDGDDSRNDYGRGEKKAKVDVDDLFD